MTNHPSTAFILISQAISQYLRVGDLICLFVFVNSVILLTYILEFLFLVGPKLPTVMASMLTKVMFCQSKDLFGYQV